MLCNNCGCKHGVIPCQYQCTIGMASAQPLLHLAVIRTLTDLVADVLTKWPDGKEHQPDVGVRCPKADDCQGLHTSSITRMSESTHQVLTPGGSACYGTAQQSPGTHMS